MLSESKEKGFHPEILICFKNVRKHCAHVCVRYGCVSTWELPGSQRWYGIHGRNAARQVLPVTWLYHFLHWVSCIWASKEMVETASTRGLEVGSWRTEALWWGTKPGLGHCGGSSETEVTTKKLPTEIVNVIWRCQLFLAKTHKSKWHEKRGWKEKTKEKKGGKK